MSALHIDHRELRDGLSSLCSLGVRHEVIKMPTWLTLKPAVTGLIVMLPHYRAAETVDMANICPGYTRAKPALTGLNVH